MSVQLLPGLCSRFCSLTAAKTDLNLLLECLKYQMKCPDLQKQALLTIYSICEKKEDNVDLFRGMGGVAFVYNLSKSSIVHPDVKETALFTLGTLAETNVYCKNSLCRKETFSDLAGWLLKEDTPLTQRRVVVYLLSVLVANNKSGQTFAQTTGCLDILLDLFRTSFPLSTEGTLKPANATQTCQLWTSVSSALCGCVNNPQNEEGQRICVAAFPIVKTWLQQITLPRTEIFQPICSFIAMTVANNSCAQESFSASGGLETLILALVRLASEAEKSLLSCQLSVTMTKTLSACITDNSALATGLAQYGVVPQLLSLLSSPNLDPRDRLSVVLTLGHCTEASEEHQSQLVQFGGLPLIITLLTESTSEELRKASTFILQTCKQATMSLGVPGSVVKQGEEGAVEPLTNMEGYWRSARELLHRIDLLEKRQAKVAEDEQRDVGSPSPTKELGPPPLPSPLPSYPVSVKGHARRQIFKANDDTQKSALASRVQEPEHQNKSNKRAHTAYRQTSTHDVETGSDSNLETVRISLRHKRDSTREWKNESSNLNTQGEKAKNAQCSQAERYQINSDTLSAPVAHTGVGVPGQAPDGGGVLCSVCKGTGTLMSSHVTSLEGVGEPHTADSQVFKPPAPVRHRVPKEKKYTDDEDALSLCSELLDSENRRMGKHLVALHTPSHIRCSGCVLRFEEVTSRTFAALQSSCHHSCDMHKVLQEATQRFRARHCDPPLRRESQEQRDAHSDRASEAEPQRSREHWREVSLTPVRKGAGQPNSSLPVKHHRKNYNGISLTPLRRGAEMNKFTARNRKGISLTPLKKPCLPGERRTQLDNGDCALDDKPKTKPSRESCSIRRKRTDFTHEEVRYLLSGVKTCGFSWNSILWLYPFQPGRTNVDLAKKYRRIMKAKAQDVGRT
ncbi:telomere repeats-binding bouquet formation protein 1 [Centroberyx gerrardi]